jgi:hypothetical protein
LAEQAQANGVANVEVTFTQAVERRGVSLAPGQEQLRYIMHAGRSMIST